MIKEKILIELFKKRMNKNFITPHIIEYITFNNNIIELSEGTGIENKPVYGLTHREYDEKKDEFIERGLSKMFRDKEEMIMVARIIKDTNGCKEFTGGRWLYRKQTEVCDRLLRGQLEEVD